MIKDASVGEVENRLPKGINWLYAKEFFDSLILTMPTKNFPDLRPPGVPAEKIPRIHDPAPGGSGGYK